MMPVNDIGIISNGLLTALQASIARRNSGKPFSSSPLFFATSKLEHKEDTQEPDGTFIFNKLNSVMPIGTSEITVEVSDLIFAADERNVFVDKKFYKLPSYSRGAKADINGTANKDIIKIFQDSDGNTKIEATKNGKISDINLGKIAALNIHGLGGDDEIEVKVNNFFGGIVIEGGSGDDKIKTIVNRSLKKGVSIKGGDGDDIITISGSALSLLTEGGAGNDHLIAEKLNPSTELARSLFGNEGSDLIIGTNKNDYINGGAGGDTLYGKDGNNKIFGEAGNDLLVGGRGNDYLYGGDGNDLLLDNLPYTYDNDYLYGDVGNDLLEAGYGNDKLFGGSGDDALYAGIGHDTLIDTTGLDIFAPKEFYWQTLYPTKKYNTYISVNLKGINRRQELITTYNAANKVVSGYDATEDYLVDRDFIS